MPVTINGNGSITGLSVGGLPNGTVDTDTLATNSVTSTKLASGLATQGISVAQQFRQTSFTATNNSTIVFESNWEKADDASAGSLGSFADPNSSGVFTFPSTGIYYVTFTSYFEDSGYNTNAYVQIQATTDNSNWDTVSSTHFGTTYDQSGNNYQSGFVNALIDVTSTTNVKVRFRAYSNSTVSWDTSDSQNRTAATFLRLGDT